MRAPPDAAGPRSPSVGLKANVWKTRDFLWQNFEYPDLVQSRGRKNSQQVLQRSFCQGHGRETRILKGPSRLLPGMKGWGGPPRAVAAVTEPQQKAQTAGTRHASERAPGGCWSHIPPGLSVGPVCVRGPFLHRERRDRLFIEPQTAHSALNLCHGAATALQSVLGRCSWPTAAGPQSQRQVRTRRPRLWLTRGPWGPRGLLRPRSRFPEADSRVGEVLGLGGGVPGPMVETRALEPPWPRGACTGSRLRCRVSTSRPSSHAATSRTLQPCAALSAQWPWASEVTSLGLGLLV